MVSFFFGKFTSGTLLLYKMLLFLLYCTHFIECESGSPVKKPKFIGMFSVCGKEAMAGKNVTLLASKFNREALAIHLGIFHAIPEEHLSDKIDYEFYDVCNNTSALLRHLNNFLLDESYYSTLNDDEHRNLNKKETTVYAFFIYMSKELTKLAADVLAGSEIVVVSFNDYAIGHSSKSHPWYVQHGEIQKKTASFYEKFVKKYDYDFVTILSVNTKNTFLLRMYEDLVETFNRDTCVVYETLNTTGSDLYHGYSFNNSTVNKVVERFQNDTTLQFALIVGELMDIVVFNHYFNTRWNNTTPNLKLPLFYPIYEDNRSGTFHKYSTQRLLNYIETRKQRQQQQQKQDHLFGHNFPITAGSYEYSYILIAMENLFRNVNDELKKKHGKEKVTLSNKELFTIFKPKINLYNQKRPTQCTNFKCSPGYEKKLLRQNDSNWKNKYTFACVKCKNNSMKATTDANQCLPCQGKNISNAQRTVCYVPYQLQSIDYQAPASIVGFTLTLVGLLLALTTLLLFECFRKTPLVRASDVTLSEIQLLASIATFVFLLVSVPLTTTRTLCIARPLCIGVLFSLFVAITLAKAEKPLRVFLHNKKLTERDIKMTLGHQYILCFMMPSLSVLLLCVSFETKPAEIITKFDDHTLLKIVSCNTNLHIHVQLCFVAILLAACLVQAYRSRRLPDRYSESMRILCSTFACCVCLFVMIPLYFSQKENPVKELKVHWITLSIVGIILLVALYGQKITMMVFHPEKNTVQAFRRASTNRSISSNNNSRTLVITVEETSLLQTS